MANIVVLVMWQLCQIFYNALYNLSIKKLVTFVEIGIFFKKVSTHNMNLFYLTKARNWESYRVIRQMQAYLDSNRIPVIVVSPNSNQRRIKTNNTLMMKNDHFREKIFFHYNSKKQYKKENNKHDRLKTVPTKHQR